MIPQSTKQFIEAATSDELVDLDELIQSRRKLLLRQSHPRGKLTMSDIRASDIDPEKKLPYLDESNIQAGFQYTLRDGQREYISKKSGLLMTSDCTIVQLAVDESNHPVEFELVANVVHTLRKGYVRRWICRDVHEFFAQAKKLEVDIVDKKAKKQSAKMSKAREKTVKTDFQDLALKYITRKQ